MSQNSLTVVRSRADGSGVLTQELSFWGPDLKVHCLRLGFRVEGLGFRVQGALRMS